MGLVLFVQIRKQTFYLILLFLFSFDVCAQMINNVRFEPEGKTINVSYDMAETKPGQSFFISLYVTQDGGATWKGPLKGVTGNVGANQTGGLGKAAAWDVSADFPKLEGNIIIEVRAILIGGESVEMEMILVKGGTFKRDVELFGNDEGFYGITLTDFVIGKYEVTQKQWREIMDMDPSYNYNCDNCPVEQVSWIAVQEFIRKLIKKSGRNYRLPTEAEWEYAAMGGVLGHGYAYSGSINTEDVAWTNSNSASRSHPVGRKEPNELEIYDMTGNVAEWCSDWYGPYQTIGQTNPVGPESGSKRVVRGGSWNDPPRACLNSSRGYHNPAEGANSLGFRLVLVP